MEPTRIYVKSFLVALSDHGDAIKGLAHITGGGLLDNVPRILQPGLAARLHRDAWVMPELFSWLQQNGGVADSDMHRVFNYGIGMVLVVPAAKADAIEAPSAAHVDQVSQRGARVAQG